MTKAAAGLQPLLLEGERVVWSARPAVFRSATPGQYGFFLVGTALLLFGLWRLGTLYGLVPGDDAAVFAARFRGGGNLYLLGWGALAGGAMLCAQLPVYLWSMSGTRFAITDHARVLVESRGLFTVSQEAIALRGPRRAVIQRRAFDWLVVVELLQGTSAGVALAGLTSTEGREALALLQTGEADA